MLEQLSGIIIGDNYGIQVNVIQQSPEIASGVDCGGAGDQGIMVGYACNDNEALIPQELYLAKSLCRYIYEIHPEDGKVQITLNDKVVETIVASFCGISKNDLSNLVKDWLLTLNIKMVNKIYINPAGDWNQSGFMSDTGLTGRKLACDNYGPQIPIGGGAFSGKDATKVDRSGAYMARKIAVDILIAKQAKEVLVKLAYAIGVVEPVMATAEVLDIYGDKAEIEIVGYDLSPNGVIHYLKLDRPQYSEVAKWGSFGNDFIWDKAN